MPEWLGFALVIGAVAVVFAAGLWLLRRSQVDDPTKRGEDSSEPGGFDPSGGGPD